MFTRHLIFVNGLSSITNFASLKAALVTNPCWLRADRPHTVVMVTAHPLICVRTLTYSAVHGKCYLGRLATGSRVYHFLTFVVCLGLCRALRLHRSRVFVPRAHQKLRHVGFAIKYCICSRVRKQSLSGGDRSLGRPPCSPRPRVAWHYFRKRGFTSPF